MDNLKRKQVFCFSLIFFALAFSGVRAQHYPFPLNREYTLGVEKMLNKKNIDFHTSFKPYVNSEVRDIVNVDSVYFGYRKKETNEVKWIHRKLRYESFILVDTGDFYLTIDPLMNFESGKDLSYDVQTFVNTRGFMVEGRVGEKLSFFSSFRENQAVFPQYVWNYVNKYRVVPGQGSVKLFKENGWDFAMVSGAITYKPSKYFNFHFGHGKNFIGDGYRSLLLSDNSYSYPHLKISADIWKFRYTQLYCSFIDLGTNYSYVIGYKKKFASIHHLSFNPNKWINIGLFDAILWQDMDSTAYRGIDMNYLNPVIFYNTAQNGMGEADNSLIGADMKIRITDNLQFYGQFVIDDLDIGGMKKGKGYLLNKIAYQLGFKAFDLFTIPNLTFQTEFNSVRPYMYAHKVPEQNYAHYNQALAHPLGANFLESVNIINYRYKDFLLEIKFNYALLGTDTMGSHWGNDIFISDFDSQRGASTGSGYNSYGNEILQGVKTNLITQDYRISYLLNPRTNMCLTLGFKNRSYRNEFEKSETQFIYFALKTSLSNFYYDF